MIAQVPYLESKIGNLGEFDEGYQVRVLNAYKAINAYNIDVERLLHLDKSKFGTLLSDDEVVIVEEAARKKYRHIVNNAKDSITYIRQVTETQG